MRSYLIFIAVNFVSLMSSINGFSVSIAFPEMIESFDSSLVVMGWVIGIYQLISTIMMVIMGKLSDILGKKRTLMLCLGFFLIGSIVAALAPNIEVLIAARAIQAIGGGGFMPISVGIVADLFPKNRQRAIGLGMSFFTLGAVIAPTVGGWLVINWHWPAIFWINIPAVVFATIPIFLLLKSEKGKKQQIDIKGAGYFAGTLASFMVALTTMGDKTGVPWALVISLFVASGCFAALFLRHEFRSLKPIVDIEFLTRKPFLAANAYNFLFGVGVFGFSAFIPLYASTVYGLSTLDISYVLTVRAIISLAATTTMSIFILKFGYRSPLVIGAVLFTASMLLMSFEPRQFSFMGFAFSNILILMMMNGITGLSTGISMPAGNNAALDLAPDRASTISGVRGMFRQGGGSIAVAVIALVLQISPDLSHGFWLVFLGLSICALGTFPFIFILPARPGHIKKGKTSGG